MGHNTICTTAEYEPEKNPAAAACFSSADIRPAAFISSADFRRHHFFRRLGGLIGGNAPVVDFSGGTPSVPTPMSQLVKHKIIGQTVQLPIYTIIRQRRLSGKVWMWVRRFMRRRIVCCADVDYNLLCYTLRLQE